MRIMFATLTMGTLLCGAPALAETKKVDCVSTSECAQRAAEIAYESKLQLQLIVPAGAIMPFNRDACPSGWKVFEALAGRLAIGVGKGDGLSPRKLGDTGGFETHTMTVDELPPHTHGLEAAKHWGDKTLSDIGWSTDDGINGSGSIATKPTGGGVPFGTMPPYYALLYCEKI